MPVVRSFAVPILSSGCSFDRSAASCCSFRRCGAAMLMRRPWRLATMDAGTRALRNANVAQGMVAYQGRNPGRCFGCWPTRAAPRGRDKKRVN